MKRYNRLLLLLLLLLLLPLHSFFANPTVFPELSQVGQILKGGNLWGITAAVFYTFDVFPDANK